jgi:FkbM family methyltransferase
MRQPSPHNEIPTDFGLFADGTYFGLEVSSLRCSPYFYLRMPLPDFPREPIILRTARAAAQLLPKGRSVFVRVIARVTGNEAPFFAAVGADCFLIDLCERVSRTLYLYGVFEPTIAALLPRLIAPGCTVIDAGANFGYYTILGARAVSPAGHVLAFEPDPRNIPRLLANISANQLQNIEHVPLGLFDRSGSVTFNLASEGEDNLGSSSIIDARSGRRQIQIPIITLDEFAADRGIPNIELMKMDIEGAEYEALAGARSLLTSHRIRKVLVEIHNFMIGCDKARGIADQLAAVGYHAYFIREDTRVPKTLPEFLQPLASASWLDLPNPHCLFTVDPIPGVV